MDVCDIMYEECLSDTLLMDVSYILGRESASRTISVWYPIDGYFRQMDVSDIMYEEQVSFAEYRLIYRALLQKRPVI